MTCAPGAPLRALCHLQTRERHSNYTLQACALTLSPWSAALSRERVHTRHRNALSVGLSASHSLRCTRAVEVPKGQRPFRARLCHCNTVTPVSHQAEGAQLSNRPDSSSFRAGVWRRRRARQYSRPRPSEFRQRSLPVSRSAQSDICAPPYPLCEQNDNDARREAQRPCFARSRLPCAARWHAEMRQPQPE
jgi:hypothetical protein